MSAVTVGGADRGRRTASPGRLDRADVAIWVVLIALLLGLGATIAAGDRAGVGITSFSPLTDAHTRSNVIVTFGEPMDADSAEAALVIAPPTEGRIRWLGNQMIFTPRRAWQPGVVYTVTIHTGATSLAGRRLLAEVAWSFRAASPQVVFLAPALQESDILPNLWLVDPGQPDQPGQPRQLTHEPLGVENFAPSPDGTQIAYAAPTPEGTVDLFLITVATGDTRRLTRCIEAICQAPDWHPDGLRLAYERIELNKRLPALEQGAARVWLLALRDLTTTPLFRESQWLGANPRWSPDGDKLVLYDRNLGATVIVNLSTGERQQIDNYGGDTGEYRFDPAGARLVYPRLMSVGRLFTTELWLADFAAQTTSSLSGPDSPPVEDFAPTWNPADSSLAVSRRYLDGSGPATRQVYRFDPATKSTVPLFTDEGFHHTALQWSPDGGRLVMMRRPADGGDSPPDLWVYDRESATIWKVATDAYLPQWLP